MPAAAPPPPSQTSTPPPGVASAAAERRFLRGPRSRWAELVSVVRIAAEFLRAFRVLHFLTPSVTVFGSEIGRAHV